MKSIGRGILNVAGLAAIGLVPMLIAVAGLKAVAVDGTVLWEFPTLPSVSVTVFHRPHGAPGNMAVVSPAKPFPSRPPVRRAGRIDI